MKYGVEILIGLIGATIFALLEFVIKVAVPIALDCISDQPSIRGKWDTFDVDPMVSSPVGFAEISQRGRRVRISLTRVLSRTGEPSRREFYLRGTFSSGQLRVLFEDAAATGFTVGAVVFHLSSNAKTFAGKTTYFDHCTNRVVAHDLWLVRSA